ncbi:hypothetical protein Bca4012_019355 [Brassica carinata]
MGLILGDQHLLLRRISFSSLALTSLPVVKVPSYLASSSSSLFSRFSISSTPMSLAPESAFPIPPR